MNSELQQLERLQQGEWFNNSRPIILTAAEAFTRQSSGNRFYTVSWWDELPAGFTRFDFQGQVDND